MKTKLYYSIYSHIDYLMYSALESIGATSGDTSPLQELELDNHIEQIEKILFEILRQNIDTPIYYDIETDSFLTEHDTRTLYRNSDYPENNLSYSDWIRNTTDKNGTLTEIRPRR